MAFQIIYQIISFLCNIQGSRFIGPLVVPFLPIPLIPIIPIPGPLLFLVVTTIHYLIKKSKDHGYWDSMKSVFPVYWVIGAVFSFIFFSMTCGLVEFAESGFGVL